MYTLLFAGLSAHSFDQNSQTLKYDEKVPFIRDISTFSRRADGTSKEYLMPQKFDELLGANMIFAPAEDAPHFPNEVLKLHQMNGKTFVGWLFGGIKAEIPNLTPSSANKRMFKVFVTPKNALGTENALVYSPLLRVTPNPFFSGQKIKVEGVGEIRNLLLFSADGLFLGDFGKDLGGLEMYLEAVSPGVYFLQIAGEKGHSVGKVVKI